MTSETQATESQAAPAAEAPEPKTFDALPLSASVRRALDEMGFTHPTPVQLEVYEPAAAHHDLIVQSRTGTGKTAAFGIPIVDRLVRDEPGVQVLVLAPTRELALQSAREISRIGAHKDLRTTAVYGGAPMEKQVRELRAGAQIVSGTPGRVLDHLRRGTLDARGIRVLVLDEADEMLSMGFAKELNAIVERLPPDRQTLLFSATVDDDVRRLSRRHMSDPHFITLSGDRVGAEGVDHFVYFVTGAAREQDLVRILEVEDPESAIVFCNMKSETELVAAALQQAGFEADWLNGDLPQSEREKIMDATRREKLRFLVATDVAARGIDISHLTHVINFTFPPSIEQYIHRTGRTGRAGRTGTAVSLVSPQEIGNLYYLRLQYKVFPIERSLPTEGEERTRREADRVTLLEQAFPDTPPEIDLAVARRLMTHPQAERILGGLLRAFFGARGGEVDEEAAAARRARPPRGDESEETASASAPAGATNGRPRRGRKKRAPEAAADVPGEDDAPDDDAAVLYVNIGRRNGIRAGDLEELLLEEAGLDEDDILRIRMRDRHSFVEVPGDRADEVIEALSGTRFDDRDLLVERAKTAS
ncbi:MAG TPA: DEAD/DEAH box helicase [Polyangiaceae bacterium LLY-WYZ-14_1]|nr:DEAD/DEAH box helicase [Polyangiaceae bacterium LLY-WYZ-14_1]